MVSNVRSRTTSPRLPPERTTMFILISLYRFCLCVACPVLITIHGDQRKELVQDYLSKGVRTAAILATILVASTATAALTPDLYINQLNGANISTCTPT